MAASSQPRPRGRRAPVPPAVRLSFSPEPAYVRTVRLVASAVARRLGVAPELLDEVQLAIDEACTRAVGLHRRFALDALIDVAMTGGARFTVQVTDRAPATPPEAEGSAGDLDEEEITAGVGLALLKGLVRDLTVDMIGADGGTEITMSWPTQRRSGR